MRYLNSITLKVELLAGTDIRSACCDLCELANRTGCLVEASFNGIKLWARRADNPLELVEAYEKELSAPKSKITQCR